MKIKNIVFDFGGVLANLEIPRTEAAFRALVGDAQKHLDLSIQLAKEQHFERFETGDIEEEDFVSRLIELNPNPVNAAQVTTAWSAMLLDVPQRRLDFLKDLKAAGYKLYLLSNINVIHLRDILAIIEQGNGLGQAAFEAHFDKVYYSHLIGLRKPGAAPYAHVLEDAKLEAGETLFIDDTAKNLEGARAVGMQTLHHPSNTDIVKRLKGYLDIAKSTQIG